MTGYKSKRAAAQDKLDDNDTLTIAYQSGYYDGKKAAQRPWVGLTDKDKTEILNTTERDERGFVMELVEAKLKEKNNAA
jgi:hypothetical protein